MTHAPIEWGRRTDAVEQTARLARRVVLVVVLMAAGMVVVTQQRQIAALTDIVEQHSDSIVMAFGIEEDK